MWQGHLSKIHLNKTINDSKFDSQEYWKLIENSCRAQDYARSKQQQDHRADACLQIFKAIKFLNEQRK